jgi:hypothetical protein
MFFALLIFCLLLLFKKATIFFILTLIVATLTYFNYYIKLPFDISPVLFISLIISREYSFLLAAIFIIISGIIPMIMAGGSFDLTTIFYSSLILIVNLVNSFLVHTSILPVFIILSILDHILGTIGGLLFFGSNPTKELVNLLLQIIVDVLYIISFSSLLVSLIQ